MTAVNETSAVLTDKTLPANAHNESLKSDDAAHLAERGALATDHHGNPLIVLDKAQESRLRLKIDLYIVPTVALIYLFCFIDRANIGNARIAGMATDLKFQAYDYNKILSVFYISYILFEIPCTVLCKYIGPGWFLPLTSLGFGICSLGTAFVETRAGACGVRFLLGIFEAGMMPGIAYYLSRWYRRSELAFRLSLYIVMAPLAGAFGGLLASGILKLDHFGATRSWRMIFAIEGIMTIVISIVALFALTDRPATARWLTQEEKDLAVARVKAERIGATEVLDGIDAAKLSKGIFSPVTLATGSIFLLNNITVQGLAVFAPTIVATIYPNSSTISKQLHTVPPYIAGAFVTVIVPYFSWRFDRRTIFLIFTAPFAVVGYIMFVASTNPQLRYGALFVIAMGPFSSGALCNAIVSANVVSDTARSAAISTNVMLGSLGGLISTWSFLPFDAPNYPIGNRLNLATSLASLLGSIGLLAWMKRNNKTRDMCDAGQRLAGLKEKEIQDLDWSHPSFRWHL